MNSQKIIKEWEKVLSRDPLDVPWDLIDETLITLKGQEAEAEMEGGGSDFSSWWFVCGECHTAIDPKDRYCRQCGRRIIWHEL